jgi:hypothetical protein
MKFKARTEQFAGASWKLPLIDHYTGEDEWRLLTRGKIISDNVTCMLIIFSLFPFLLYSDLLQGEERRHWGNALIDIRR